MDAFNSSMVSQTHDHDEDRQEEPRNTHNQSIISTLPRENGWLSTDEICLIQYQGFWYYPSVLNAILDYQRSSSYLNLSSSDILLCSAPKSGTTWLKALTFAIATRNRHPNPENSPLLTSLPHVLIPFIEPPNKIDRDPQLHLLSTHLPYTHLPKLISDCNCKIVYICRNPKDAFISRWHFAREMRPNKDSTKPIPLDEAFDLFCRGISSFAPYWDHALSYWKASQERYDKILFLKYEDMMSDPISNVIRLAKFIGYPFSNVEKVEGLPLKIVEMCSFQNLSNLEVNKSGTTISLHGVSALPNDKYFRKGKVGD